MAVKFQLRAPDEAAGAGHLLWRPPKAALTGPVPRLSSRHLWSTSTRRVRGTRRGTRWTWPTASRGSATATGASEGSWWSRGEPVQVTLTLYPTSNLFMPGHRIRLDVSSSNFPRFDV